MNYNGVVYLCLSENGYKFDDIRIPMVGGWIEAETTLWQPIDYPLWAVVEYDGAFYTLMTLDGFDNNIDPLTSDCWGAIADYDSAYNDYELSDHEYVVYGGRVFYLETDVNADVPELSNNLSRYLYDNGIYKIEYPNRVTNVVWSKERDNIYFHMIYSQCNNIIVENHPDYNYYCCNGDWLQKECDDKLFECIGDNLLKLR